LQPISGVGFIRLNVALQVRAHPPAAARKPIHCPTIAWYGKYRQEFARDEQQQGGG
jgi:hypothetical protein